MSMKLSDRVFAKPRGSADDVIAFARENGAERMDFLEAWAREVERLCKLAGMDPSLPWSQSHLETGGWKKNKFWNQGNPGGMGVPSDPRYIEEHVFSTGEGAAAAQVVHLALYASGGIPDALKDYEHFDFRIDNYWDAVRENDWPDAAAKTIDEFGNGKWAEDPNYSEKWRDRGNLIWPKLADQETIAPPKPIPTPTPGKIRGHVPRPPITDHCITKRIGCGRDADQDRAIVGTAMHTMEGTYDGNISWFASPDVCALTDYAVAMDGRIMRYNCEPDQVTWASGPARAPSGDGARFISRWGVGAVNVKLRSIEHDRYADTPVSADMWRRSCWLVAWTHAEEAGQTADDFDWNIHHWEMTGKDYKVCPGSRFWGGDITTQYQAFVKAIMRHFQFGVPLTRYWTIAGVRVDAQEIIEAGPMPSPDPTPTPHPEPKPTPTPKPTPQPQPKPTPSPPSPRITTEQARRERAFDATVFDGRVIRYVSGGEMSDAWVARGEKTGQWPEIESCFRDEHGRLVGRFADGWEYPVEDEASMPDDKGAVPRKLIAAWAEQVGITPAEMTWEDWEQS